jgi:hypothetical protein
VAGEAGREDVVPEGKTTDLGGGLKLFDTDDLGRIGRGAEEQGSRGEKFSSAPLLPSTPAVLLAKGGIIDYEAYGAARPNTFDDAIRQVAYELSGGQFAGDVDAAKAMVRQHIEENIKQLAANPPQHGLPGLMASSMPGRVTDLMAMALGPNPAAADFSTWNELLGEYGLSADMQPLGVNPGQIDTDVKRQLQAQTGNDPSTGSGYNKEAYRAALAEYMKGLNAQLAGKDFSHANYGNVYNAIPGWQGYWNTPAGRRPASTVPAIALSDTARANLERLIGGVGGNRVRSP